MTVITFATKTDVFSFFEKIREMGVSGNIVPTPKQLKMGCGLSVGISDNYFPIALKIVNYMPFRSFRGIYRITNKNGVKILTKLV